MMLKLLFVMIGFILGSEVYSYNDQTFAINWVPIEYKVLLDMNDIFDKFTKKFQGEVIISGITSSEINELVLHNKLNITEIYLEKNQIEKLYIDKNHIHQQEDGILKLYLNTFLAKDSFFVIHIKYTGELSDTAFTFIPKYNNKHQFRPLIATSFQKYEARELFPCVDFPRFKAKFTLEVLKPRWIKVLSNMPMVNTTWGKLIFNMPIKDTFNKSLPMSTYMFALVLLQDNYLKKSLRNGITIWFNENDNVNFIEDKVPYLLDALKNYTGISYVLPKLDLVVVPNKGQTSVGNWGLVTWSSDMFDHINSVGLQKLEYTYNFLAKKMAEHWFGNLVTCNTWCLIWLNECLSTYVGIRIVQQAFPDMTYFNLFFQNTIMSTMEYDSKNLLSLVNTDTCFEDIDIMEKFGPAYINKGTAILHMVENNLMDKETFKNAIQSYLTVEKLSTINEVQFWNSLEEQIDSSVKAEMTKSINHPNVLNAVMKTWIYNKGYPLVQIHRFPEGINVTQRLFSKPMRSNSEYWWIPLTYTTSKENNFYNLKVRKWIKPTNKLQTLDLKLSNDEWIVLNIEHAGFYRVLYDELTYQLISDHLNKNIYDIHHLNRAQILNDAFELASENLLNLTAVLNLTKYLKKESHHLPLSVGMDGLEKLRSQVVDESLTNNFTNLMKNFIVDNLNEVISNIFTKNTMYNHFYYIKLVELACKLDLYYCMRQAEQLALSIISDKHEKYELIPELKYTLWCSAVRVGTWDITKYLLRKLKSTPKAEEAIEYAKYLLCSKDPHIITQVLNHLCYRSAFSENIVTQLKNFITPLDSNCILLNFLEEKFNLILLKIGWNGITEFLKDVYHKVKAKAIFCEIKVQEIALFHHIIYTWPNARAWERNHRDELSLWFRQNEELVTFKQGIISNHSTNKNIFCKQYNYDYFKLR